MSILSLPLSAGRLVVPALLALAFLSGVFLRGLDQLLFVPGLLCVLAAVLVLIWPGLRAGRWDIPGGIVACTLGGFWAWLGFALFFSDVPYLSTIFTLLIGVVPLLALGLVQSRDGADHTLSSMSAIAALLTLLGVWAGVQFLFLGHMTSHRVHHPMLNANNLAVILSLGIFLWLYIASRVGAAGRVAAGLCALICLIGVLVTQSRGGMLGLVCGLGLIGLAFLNPARDEGRKPLSWKVIFAFAAAMVVVTLVVIVAFFIRYGHFHVLTGGMPSINERFMIWGAAWGMMWTHPLTGTGLGTFYLTYPPHRPLGDISDGFFVHMDPLQFGVETGVAGMVLFYAFAMAVLVRMVAACRRAGGMPMTLILPFAGLVALMINAHVNFDLYMLPALLLAALFLAAWFIESEKILGPCRIAIDWNRIGHRAIILSFIALFFILSPAWIARAGFSLHQLDRAGKYIAAGQFDAARPLIDRAMMVGPYCYARMHYMDSLWHGRRLQAQSQSMTRSAILDGYNHAVAAGDRAVSCNPYYVHALNYQAMLHFIAAPALDPDGLRKAEAVLDRALAVDPLNFDVRIGLSRIYEGRGEHKRAVDILIRMMDWRVIERYAPPPYIRHIVEVMERQNHPDLNTYRDLLRERVEYHNARVRKINRLDDAIATQRMILRARAGF